MIPTAPVVNGMSPYETKYDATILVAAGGVVGALGPRTTFGPPSEERYSDKENVVIERRLLIGGRKYGDWDMDSNSENLEPGTSRKVGAWWRETVDRNIQMYCGRRLNLHGRMWGEWDCHTDDVGELSAGSHDCSCGYGTLGEKRPERRKETWAAAISRHHRPRHADSDRRVGALPAENCRQVPCL